MCASAYLRAVLPLRLLAKHGFKVKSAAVKLQPRRSGHRRPSLPHREVPVFGEGFAVTSLFGLMLQLPHMRLWAGALVPHMLQRKSQPFSQNLRAGRLITLSTLGTFF